MDGWMGNATLPKRRNDNIWSCNEAPCCSAAGWQLVLPNAHQATVNEAHSVVKTEIKNYYSFKGGCKNTASKLCAVKTRRFSVCASQFSSLLL